MEIDFFLMNYNYTILIWGKTLGTWADQKHEPNAWALTVIYYGSRANFRIKSHKKLNRGGPFYVFSLPWSYINKYATHVLA